MNDYVKSECYRRCQKLFESLYPHFRDAGQQYWEIIANLVNPQTTVLEIGCGRTSLASEEISKAKYSAGTDVSLLDLRHNITVTYRVAANGAQLPFPSCHFDLIISQWVIEHLEMPKPVFVEMSRVLRSRGRIILLTTNANNYIPLLSRIIPSKWHGRLIEHFLHRPSHESFPTFYRANTYKRLELLGHQSGLKLEECIYIGSPFYLAFSPLLFKIALLFEKLTDASAMRGLKLYLIAKLRKGYLL